MGIFTADKAGSRKKAEIVTFYGNSVRAAYVKIEKAAQRVAFLDGNEKFLWQDHQNRQLTLMS